MYTFSYFLLFAYGNCNDYEAYIHVRLRVCSERVCVRTHVCMFVYTPVYTRAHATLAFYKPFTISRYCACCALRVFCGSFVYTSARTEQHSTIWLCNIFTSARTTKTSYRVLMKIVPYVATTIIFIRALPVTNLYPSNTYFGIYISCMLYLFFIRAI